MLFANFMNWALDQSGVSNYKLAKRLGISQTTVANWLNGVTEPRKKQRAEVLDIFGVDEDDLETGFPAIHYKEDPTPEGQKEKPPAQGGELSEKERIVLDKLSRLTPENVEKAREYLDLLLIGQEKKETN